MASILLVDDDEMMSHMMSLRLHQVGHQVDLAENGREGIRKALAGGYQLVLMDMQMPGINGREAVRHLNKTGLLKRERGRGTVVNKAEFEQSLGTLYSLFQSVESTGVSQTSEVLGLAVVTDPADYGELPHLCPIFLIT